VDFLLSLKNRRLLIVAAVIVIGGGVFWASDLSSDAPMYYGGLGQSLATDPAQYIHHARNQILFDDWDPFDYPHWTVYQHSLTSLIGYGWFLIAGVSFEQANAVGIIMSLLGLVLILLGLARHHRPWVLAAVALCYVINVTLLTYGRLPYLENGLILIAAGLFCVYSWWGERLWGILLCGVLAGAAAIVGKLFGALLLPALLAAIWLVHRDRLWPRLIAATGGFVVTAVSLVLILYGTDLGVAFAYAGEQSYGLRGFPPGLTSPWAFLEHLVSFGFNNRMLYIDPDLFMFLVVAAVLLLLFRKDLAAFRSLPRTSALAIFWIAFFFVGLMPLSYSPLRYALILIPPIILLVFTLIDGHLTEKRIRTVNLGYVRLVGLAIIVWFFLHHILRNVFFFNDATAGWTGWVLAPVAVVAAVVIRWFLLRRPLAISRNMLIAGLLVMLGLSVISNGFRIRRLHYLDHAYSLLEANQDIEQILAPNAVVSGPYGPALTVDTKLHTFIHLFAVAEIDSTLFDRYPVTHLALDESSYENAVKNYPVLKDARFVAQYWIRDVKVTLYRINRLFDNVESARYEPTFYERAQDYRQANQIDSSMLALQAFMETNATTRSSGILLADLLVTINALDQALQLLIQLADNYPTDFYLQMHCGRLYMIQALGTNSPPLMEMARKYFERGVKANRFKSDFAMRLAAETQRQFDSQQNP